MALLGERTKFKNTGPFGSVGALKPEDPGFYDDPFSVENYVKQATSRKKAVDLQDWEKERRENTDYEVNSMLDDLSDVSGRQADNDEMLAKGDSKSGDFIGIGGRDREQMRKALSGELMGVLQQISSVPESARTPAIQSRIVARVAQLPARDIRQFFELGGKDEVSVAKQIEQMLQSGTISLESSQLIQNAMQMR